MQQDCIFCKIIKGEIPSYKVYEDGQFLAFLDISQFTRGHTMVVPKEHVEFVWDYQENGNYFEVVTKIANHYKTLGYKYVDSMIMGRHVPHAHIHLLPHNGENNDYREALNSFDKLAEETRRPSKEEFQKIVREFRFE